MFGIFQNKIHKVGQSFFFFQMQYKLQTVGTFPEEKKMERDLRID